MILQNIKQIIKQTYFWQSQQNSRNKKQFIKYRPRRMTAKPGKKTAQHLPAEIQQVCALMKSEQRCENWIIIAEARKQNYAVKRELYNCIMQGKINVHNLFLLLIQCKVLPENIWIPIETLCKLEGDSENQLCCLIHYTVSNLGRGQSSYHNQIFWDRMKAERELGPNFQKIYNNNQMSLHQKIAILPMVIVLNSKNSAVLWNKLSWLFDLPHEIIVSLKANMRKLVQQRLSSIVSVANPDFYLSKMSIKAIQLLEVDGFISVKNLFRFAYQLYNIPLLLSLLAQYKPAYEDSHRIHQFRLQLIQFIIQLFECMEAYEFEVDIGRGGVEIGHLKTIIVKNKLYMEQLNDIRFNQQLQNIVDVNKWGIVGQLCHSQHSNQLSFLLPIEDYFEKAKNIQNWLLKNFKIFEEIKQQNKSKRNRMGSNTQKIFTNFNTDLARIIPMCPSSYWLLQSPNNLAFPPHSHETYSQDHNHVEDSLTPEQRISKWMSEGQQTVITDVLCQLYHLKIDYLQILYSIMLNCYSQNEQPWSQINSSFYKLQLYLIKNHIFQFLVLNFNALQTKNNPTAMICFYKIIGFLLKANPISYGVFDRILLQIEDNSGKQVVSRKKEKTSQKTKVKEKSKIFSNPVSCFSQSFIHNMALSKSTILMVLSDQFEWHENQQEQYPNATYQSFFVSRVIKQQRFDWMVSLISNICHLCPIQINGKKAQTEEQASEKNHQKFEWVTLLLSLHYYFQETVNVLQKNKNGTSKRERNQENILAPNRAYLQKIMQSQKFLQKLYPMKVKVPYYKLDNSVIKLSCIEEASSTQKQLIIKEQRMLVVLQQVMEAWQQFYLSNSKKRIVDNNLSFPMLRVYKKKLKSRISVFIKAQQYEERDNELQFQYVNKKINRN